VEGYRYSEEERQALLPWIDASVPEPPSPQATCLGDRLRGMLLGVAIGDALGNTSEGMTPAERRDIHGRKSGDSHADIRDYLPNRREEERPVGLPSDDTQLTFWTVESLLRKRHLDPVDLAETFTRQDRIYGIGSTVTAFCLHTASAASAGSKRGSRAPGTAL